MRQVVHQARLERSRDERAGGATSIDAACDEQQRLSRPALELAPQLIGAPQQRHVTGILGISEPDDACGAVRGAAIMSESELLETEHTHASAGEVIERGTAHPARADDDDVVGHDRHPAEDLDRVTRVSRSPPESPPADGAGRGPRVGVRWMERLGGRPNVEQERVGTDARFGVVDSTMALPSGQCDRAARARSD